MQIEHSTWQHRIALQMCAAHCLCSLSTLRCGVEKSLRTTNETVLPAHINLSVGSACQNALCSADDATKAETAAVRRLSTLHIYENHAYKVNFLIRDTVHSKNLALFVKNKKLLPSISQEKTAFKANYILKICRKQTYTLVVTRPLCVFNTINALSLEVNHLKPTFSLVKFNNLNFSIVL